MLAVELHHFLISNFLLWYASKLKDVVWLKIVYPLLQCNCNKCKTNLFYWYEKRLDNLSLYVKEIQVYFLFLLAFYRSNCLRNAGKLKTWYTKTNERPNAFQLSSITVFTECIYIAHRQSIYHSEPHSRREHKSKSIRNS